MMMNVFKNKNSACLLFLGCGLLGAACAAYIPPAAAGSTFDQKFETITQGLNTRFKNVLDCGSAPVWTCSGLVMRSTSYLVPKPDATVLSHYFISKGTNTRNLYGEYYGFILEPSVENLGNRLQCIYPRDADTWGDLQGYHRSADHYHCSDTTTQSSADDLSSCKKVLKPKTQTADAWYKAFTNNYPDRSEDGRKQCSFSVKDNNQFNAAIRASADNDGIIANNPLHATWNELVVKPWGENDMPRMEAIFYAAVPGQGFLDADRIQAEKLAAQYRQVTGVAIPVVKIDLEHNMVSLSSWRPDELAANLLKNNLAEMTVTGSDGRESWADGSQHDDWRVGATGLASKEPVEALGSSNAGLPVGEYKSAVKLAVNNQPGRIYAKVSLMKGAKYTVSWVDAWDNYQATGLTETDGYSWRIGKSVNETTTDYLYQNTYTTQKGWEERAYSFTAPDSGDYYLSFRGKSRADGKSRGALITRVSIVRQ